MALYSISLMTMTFLMSIFNSLHTMILQYILISGKLLPSELNVDVVLAPLEFTFSCFSNGFLVYSIFLSNQFCLETWNVLCIPG